MTFEEYLVSKKIDQGLFKDAEPKLFQEWKNEFEQLHPNSFTAQKLYLINPIRRKYILKQEPKIVVASGNAALNTKERIVNEQVLGTIVGSNEVSNQSTEQKPESPSVDKPAPSPSSKPARPVFKPKPKMN
jgi:hypothetical protein